MDSPTLIFALGAFGFAALTLGLLRAKNRLELSKAKHPSLAGHPRISRRVASLVPFYDYDEDRFFRADGAPDSIATRRKAAFLRMTDDFRKRFAVSTKRTAEARESISDLQFTENYRVPFQFSRMVRTHLDSGMFLESSDGVTVTDLDGNTFYDLAGSYGVNVFGYDFYKSCITRAEERARSLGPVLGAYHSVITENVQRLREISGLDEVSFHMSGTEAVMQAVRLARYHTGRTHLVRFCGAYHGWWGDVQPGIGNPGRAYETYTLKEMSEDSLRVLRTRKDIACILINPVQALHPNASAPGDSALVDSSRRAHFDRAGYTEWLKQLRAICDQRNIALIFDEVFVGFRLARGGAQEYFGVCADMVTYGKTLGGGLPVGVLCGRRKFMKRYRDDRPADICFARGTFNSHPYVMTAMNEFLTRLDEPIVRDTYAGLDDRWDKRAAQLNSLLDAARVPLQVANLSSIWTVIYTKPSRYNWMLQYYLRAEGIALSWIGTGRLIFSLNYSDADFAAVCDRFVRAAVAMQDDGWWWSGPITDRSIKRAVLTEMLAHRFTRNQASEHFLESR
jgi:glutamate-1-semialdehyde 2,1-aminomutase